MLTAEDLLAAGFKECTDSFSRADRFFQKRVYGVVDGEQSTLYFINLYYYKFQEHESWELDMSFDRGSHFFPYCWIKYRVDNSTAVDVEDIEYMAKDIFESDLGKPYDD